MNRTIKNLLLGFFVLTALFQGCKGCKNYSREEGISFGLSGSVEETELLLEKKEASTLVILNVIAKNEEGEEEKYKITSWKLSASMKGKLTSGQGETVTQDAPLKKGENIFYYTPQSLGKHILSMEVSTEEGEEKLEISFEPIEVEKKVVPFKIKLQPQDEKGNSLFSFQEAKLKLEVTSGVEEAEGLKYSVKSIKVSKGSLYFESGQEVQQGSKIDFGVHDLVFKPSGEVGDASIQLTLENEEEGIQTVSLSLKVKPIEFEPMVSFELLEEEVGDYAEVRLSLSKVDPELAEETFKLVEFTFSDGVQRDLLDQGLNRISSPLLTPGNQHKFLLALDEVKLEQDVFLTLKIAGPKGHTEENQLFFCA